jgi:hypothetical protein
VSHITWILDQVSTHSDADSASLSFVGTDVHHKRAISHKLPFRYCLAWDTEDCVESLIPPTTLGQASKLVCFCFVPDWECGFILYELKEIQDGASVLIDHRIVHRNMISGFLGGYMKYLDICECNGAENMWCKKLSLIGRVLVCPGPSVVPG